MATNQVLIKDAAAATPKQISFNNGSYVAGATETIEVGTPTDVVLDLLDLIDTAAEQSAQADLGAVRASRYTVTAVLEFDAGPTTGELVEFYWAASSQSTAANGNPGYATGVTGAYDGGVATLAEGVAQLAFIGVMVCSADAAKQLAHVGVFSPTERYGSLIVKNESGVTIADTDSVESAVVLTPIVDDIAAAS